MFFCKEYFASKTIPSSLIIISVTAILKYPPSLIGIYPLIIAAKDLGNFYIIPAQNNFPIDLSI